MSLSVDNRTILQRTMEGKVPKAPHGNISVFATTRDKLRVLKYKTGFRTYDGMINYFCESSRDAAPFATYEFVLKDSRPLILTGATGSGKTYFVKTELLSDEGLGNCLIIDASNEYGGIDEVSLGDIFSLKWEKPRTCAYASCLTLT